MKVIDYFLERFGKREAKQLDNKFRYWNDQSVDALEKRIADLKEHIKVASSSESYEAQVKVANKENEIDYINNLIELKKMKAQSVEKKEVKEEVKKVEARKEEVIVTKEVTEKKEVVAITERKAFLQNGDTVIITLQRDDPEYKRNGEIGKISSVKNFPAGTYYKVGGSWWCESDIRAHRENTEMTTKEETFKENMVKRQAMNLNCEQLKQYVLLELFDACYSPVFDEVTEPTEEVKKQIANKTKSYGLSEEKAIEFVDETSKFFMENIDSLKESKSVLQGGVLIWE